jgi:quercetin dioxygenase-like cupin family protein
LERDVTQGSAAKPPVLRLSDLADYQAGSIVSRQILKSDAGNVTLFAFDAGQQLSDHSPPFDALLEILEGEATVTVGGAASKLGAGDAIVLPANVPHAVLAASRFKMLLTMIRA